MYVVTDSFGTRQVAWTWAQALSWLACCSERATIANRLTGRVLAARHQGAGRLSTSWPTAPVGEGF